MTDQHLAPSDYGTGQKKLSIYVTGLSLCVALTLLSFWAVSAEQLSDMQILAIIYASAVAQFFVQLVCFLRLNTETEQGRMNVLSLVFTGIILLCIVTGSLWIMWNLNYFMMN
ncbi:MAG TPA: cytochrome o ubiquinol oxidase subunit IV [Gammaproteobacteria bacterium]|jgi:cytochrome o ubiquinol oxidase operon protein cyoD|nr:cytochrome o ubiquinol oxidase subunit IV [Gammaproteobacteria bacterium]